MRRLDLAGPELAVTKELLRQGIDALEKASESLRNLYRTQQPAALAGAAPFLELFGTIAAGWLMAKAASSTRGEHGELSGAKGLTAQFFAEQRLATASALLPAIAGGATVMKLDADRM
jgi:hypothetical protein